MAEPESGDFMQKFIASHSVPKDTLDYFSSKPWAVPWLSNPRYEPIPTFSRVLKPTGEDYFFSTTVSTPTTIPRLVTLRRKDLDTPVVTAPQPRKEYNHKSVTEVPENPDTVFFLSLGYPGIDGHPSTVHGGMLCAILDEMMGLCVMLHHQKIAGPRDSLYTVNLNTTYRAAVPTPSDILVKSWLTRREGRKWSAIGQIVNPDGLVMTEAEGLWVLTKSRL